MPQPVSRRASDARTIAVVGDIYAILLTGEETGGSHCMIEALVSPGGGPPPHTHSREDEVFYILEGEITFEIEGRQIVATPGQCVFAPRGIKHRFFNATHKPARMTFTLTPPGLERMFLEIGAAVPAGSTTPLPVGPADSAKVVEACSRYGIAIEIPGP